MNAKRAIHCLVAGVITFVATTSLVSADKPQRFRDLLNNERALEAFVNGIVTNRMQESHVPGAVVTVVKGDRIIFSEGYGFANRERRTPVDPDKTLFRIGSVSKVFNAMAIMRMVDEGLFTVEEDVRPRLAAAGLELDNSVEGPITLKALLTHTAGIRDWNLPGPTEPGKVLPLGDYLQQCRPLRWQAPGETVLYTDHGITLAGYVAELASKTKYEEAVIQRVMCPLGMNHTGYTIDDVQRADLAIAYSYEGTDYKPRPFFYSNIDPAVGVFTTGSDMARLMSAHLSGCKGFLKPATVKLMHEPQHSDDPRLGVQWTCGFVYETRSKLNEPYLFHVGGAFGFQSVLGISMKRGLGVFVAQNQPGTRVFQLVDLLDAIADDEGITPGVRPAQSSVTAAQIENIKGLAGTYVINRSLSEGIKLSKADGAFVRYAEDIKGIDVEYWELKGKPVRFIQVAPLLFRAVNGDERVSFRTSKDGKTKWLFDYNMRGDGAYKRIATTDRGTGPK